ncbi:hypothetical protein Sjap_008957 [Stephania japonica]|uniref:Cytochrome c oxidase subunit 6b-1 n=1 Tax=Stephania japonica TaxID=461633 RepID=A0AAP0JS26_9MAGN
MAEVESAKIPTLAEEYLLPKKEEQPVQDEKPVEETVTEEPTNVVQEEVASQKVDDVVEEKTNEQAEEIPVTEESDSTPDQQDSEDQEVTEETTEIKLETAPADVRFPTTNQTRHCFTRYIEYHRCIAAKGEGAPECDRFAKYYRSLCPGEWIDRWNEQRENGTFPGPL